MSAANAQSAKTSALEAMAAYASSLTFTALPSDIVAKAKTCIIDALSGCFAVAHDARPRAALRSVALDAGTAASTIVGTTHKAGDADAAFVNAVATGTTDRSDTHAATATHPGIVVIPAALAVAERRGLSGAALIEAIVVGYETMGRLGHALITPEIVAVFRSSGLTGPTGAAFAAARAMSLLPREMVNAASLAAQTSSGLNAWAHAGTDEHAFHIGFAARNGILAAHLAANGAVAAPTALDGRAGLLSGFGAQEKRALLIDGLGERFEMRGVVHKPAPACFFAQTPAQVAAMTARLIKADEIESIDAFVSDVAARFPGCDNAGPMRARQDAAMSIQFCVASVLWHGAIDERSWRAFDDAPVNDLAQRIRVVVDSDFSTAVPRQGARLVVNLRDGRVVENARPDFRSMTHDEVVERFLEAAEAALPAARRHAAVDAVMRIERLDDVGRLARLVAAE